MTWVHTTGQNQYDTPSGDLEVGEYAVQANGSYIKSARPFVSSTSTPAQISTSTPTAQTSSSALSSTPSSDSAPSADESATTTGTETGRPASGRGRVHTPALWYLAILW